MRVWPFREKESRPGVDGEKGLIVISIYKNYNMEEHELETYENKLFCSFWSCNAALDKLKSVAARDGLSVLISDLEDEFKAIENSPVFEENEDGEWEEVCSGCYEDLEKRIYNMTQYIQDEYYSRKKYPKVKIIHPLRKPRRCLRSARSYRSPRRASFSLAASSSGGGGDSGDSDQGDPPGPLVVPSLSVNPFISNHKSFRPWPCLGSLCMERRRTA